MSRAEKPYIPRNEAAYSLMEQAVCALLDDGRRLVGRQRRQAALSDCLRYTILGLEAHRETQDEESSRRASSTIQHLHQQLQRISNAPSGPSQSR